MSLLFLVAVSDIFPDSSPLRPLEPTSTIHYDYLVYAVGAETQTFGIPGVKENAYFMKEIADAEQVRTSHACNLPSHAFSDAKTFSRLRGNRCLPRYKRRRKTSLASHGIFFFPFLYLILSSTQVVVGGGPTGIEVAGELHDFLEVCHLLPHSTTLPQPQ